MATRVEYGTREWALKEIQLIRSLLPLANTAELDAMARQLAKCIEVLSGDGGVDEPEPEVTRQLHYQRGFRPGFTDGKPEEVLPLADIDNSPEAYRPEPPPEQPGIAQQIDQVERNLHARLDRIEKKLDTHGRCTATYGFDGSYRCELPHGHEQERAHWNDRVGAFAHSPRAGRPL